MDVMAEFREVALRGEMFIPQLLVGQQLTSGGDYKPIPLSTQRHEVTVSLRHGAVVRLTNGRFIISLVQKLNFSAEGE